MGRLIMAPQVIETMRFEKGEIPRLHLHLERLKKTAQQLNYSLDLEFVRHKISSLTPQRAPQKLRLLLTEDGSLSLEASKLGELPKTRVIGLSEERTHSENPWLAIKTTQRELYETEYQKYAASFYDILFLNEKDQLTEASRHNLFVVIDGAWYTPPLTAGALPGVMRSALFNEHWSPVLEKDLYLNDLKSAESIWLSNSVRELVEVQLSPQLQEAL